MYTSHSLHKQTFMKINGSFCYKSHGTTLNMHW